jgi:hypothetical protein
MCTPAQTDSDAAKGYLRTDLFSGAANAAGTTLRIVRPVSQRRNHNNIFRQGIAKTPAFQRPNAPGV